MNIEISKEVHEKYWSPVCTVDIVHDVTIDQWQYRISTPDWSETSEWLPNRESCVESLHATIAEAKAEGFGWLTHIDAIAQQL